MATIKDQTEFSRLLRAARGTQDDGIAPTSRDYGYVVALYRKFGDAPVRAGRLAVGHISDPLVLENFDVGEYPKNRNFNDLDVVGSRLPSFGWLEFQPPVSVCLTAAGIGIAQEKIAELSAK